MWKLWQLSCTYCRRWQYLLWVIASRAEHNDWKCYLYQWNFPSLLWLSKLCILRANLWFQKSNTFKKSVSHVFRVLSHNHTSACSSKCWNLCTMPRSLSQTQRMLVLKVKTPQAEIANRTQCSILQIKKMAKNKCIFGTVIRPKIMKQGRPRIFTLEIVKVCSNSVILEVWVGFLNFTD